MSKQYNGKKYVTKFGQCPRKCRIWVEDTSQTNRISKNRKFTKEDLILKPQGFSYSDFSDGMCHNLGDPSFAVYIGNYRIANIVQDTNKRWHVSHLSYTYKSQNDAIRGFLKRLNGQCMF